MSCYSQLMLETVYDTTRADGQRFIITYPYEVKINLVDSLAIPAGDSVLRYIYPYYSKVNSTVSFKCQKKRIVTGTTQKQKDDNTRITYDWVTVSVLAMGSKIENLLNGAATRKAIKVNMKEWINLKLSQE